MIGELAKLVGALHSRGLAHRDLKAGNILVLPGPSAKVSLTDLEGLRISDHVPQGRRDKDLARLYRTWSEDCALTEADWTRFLVSYLRSAGEGRQVLEHLAYRVARLVPGRERGEGHE